jgi:hypothetical protein
VVEISSGKAPGGVAVKKDQDPELLFQLFFCKFHGKGAEGVRFVFILGLIAILGTFASRWL